VLSPECTVCQSGLIQGNRCLRLWNRSVLSLRLLISDKAIVFESRRFGGLSA
jgi:hypothetical protein